MHALGEEFDATELPRGRASLETIDLRALKFGPDCLRSASTASERVTHLHIPVPAITRGSLARTHELKSAIVVKTPSAAEMVLTSGGPSSIREYVRLCNFQNGRHYKGFVWEFR